MTPSPSVPEPGNCRIAVVGLGYVGLPLAVEFGKQFDTLGLDIDAERIAALREGRDATGETSADELAAATHLRLDSDPEALATANVFIIAVPTPVDEANRPDLSPLERASAMVGAWLKPGDIVKVTSGSTPAVAAFVDALYRAIIPAGTHLAPSLKVAEAAKVIENTQRDVNIALVNELAMIFGAMGIDTHDVLAAAGTKWNFLPFRPGLVGGHCIGVDPYYLTHKATVLGYHPELILAARRINSRMGIYVAHQVMRLMAGKRIHVVDSRILVLGLTFKENCPDLRNTRVVDVIRELVAGNAHVDCCDPWADAAQAQAELGLALVQTPEPAAYDAVVLAVSHDVFATPEWAPQRFAKARSVIYDVKSVLPEGVADGRV